MIRTFPILPENRYELSDVKFGRLYNWLAASHPNIAPVGYVVPTDAQWTTLTTYIAAEIAATRLPNMGVGNILKSQRQDPDGNVNVIIQTTTHPRFNADATEYGRDSVKFSGLPGGFRFGSGAWSNFGNLCEIWTSSENSIVPANGFYRRFSHNTSTVSRASTHKGQGNAIRFMRAATTFEQSHFADGEFVGQVQYFDEFYDLVFIGKNSASPQVWSVQNLATTRYNDGTPIPGPTFTNPEWLALETPGYCNPNDDVDNVFLDDPVKLIWKQLRDRI